jgi:peptidyl-prolyl cis-trans isomerase A (cyclophilin A)
MLKKSSILISLGAVLFFSSLSFGKSINVLMKIASYESQTVTKNYEMTIELYPDKAPITVENFLHYVRTQSYEGLLFHRLTKPNTGISVIQGGGYYFYNQNFYYGTRFDPIKLESNNGLHHSIYSLAMARTDEPNSATAEFYFNYADNSAALDYKSSLLPGYCVFGKVILGTNAVDYMGSLLSDSFQGFTEFPQYFIEITQVKILTYGAWIDGDFDNDGIEDFSDFADLAANWKKAGSNLKGDINNSGSVDAADVKVFGQHWLEKTSWFKTPDLNNDGLFNLIDYAKFAKDWRTRGKGLGGDMNDDWRVSYSDMQILSDYWLWTTPY